jgi:hypothetical protein
MGLFDWLRAAKPKVLLPQLCYDIAYFILPHYAFKDIAKLNDICLNTPSTAGLFFYIMAARHHKVEPIVEDGRRFCWHHGQLTDEREYFALEYPTPPPVDMSLVTPEEIRSGRTKFVLAPYFSAIIPGTETAETQYYVLGQAPIGGGTTLRGILPDGSNCNLGPGPEPVLSAFLASFSERGSHQ